MFNYDNFKPTNIFEKDRNNNDIYFMFDTLSKGYIVSDMNIKSALTNLEGYKYFLFPLFKNITLLKSGFLFIPPILIPIMLIVFFSQILLYFAFNINLFNYTFIELLLYIILPIYLIILFLYFYKIKKTLTNCISISKEEKKWIFSKKNSIKMANNTVLKIIAKPSIKNTLPFRFKKIHVFYTIMFLIISFPLWFVIAAILF